MRKALFILVLLSIFAASAKAQTHTATLTWTDTLNPAGTTYNVYRATGLCSGTPTFSKLVTALTVKTYADATITPGNYCYTVTAVLNGAESAQATPVNAAALPFAVTQIQVTVQLASQSDTSLLINGQPNGSPSNGTVGSNISYTAVGNVTGNSFTSTATWAPTNTAIATFVSAGQFHCVAAGTTTVTASFGSLTSGTNQLTCSAASTTGNLASCVVTGSTPTSLASVTGCANSFPPAGWTFVIADGANTSTLPANVVLGSGTSRKSLGHPPDTFSYGDYITGDSQGTSWFLNAPSGLQGFVQLDFSYWEYVDSNALYADSDYYLFSVGDRTVCSGQGQSIGINAQNFSSDASFLATSFFPSPLLGNPSNNACQGAIFTNQGFNLKVSAGAWRQYEFLVIPNTTETGGQMFPPPNCNGLSPSTSGCGNGTLKVYVNGALVLTVLNANLVGTQTINGANSFLQIGGVITSFASIDGARCVAWSLTGGGTCPGTQPGSGAPQPFNRYVTDIVVLKQ